MSEKKPVGYSRFACVPFRLTEVSQEYRCPACASHSDDPCNPWSPLSANEAQGIVCDQCGAELVPAKRI